MNTFEMIITASSSVRTNRSRSILTSLGVTIGVAAVVSLVGLVTGVGDYVESQFESVLDARVFQVCMTSGRFQDMESITESRSWPDLTEEQARALEGIMQTDSVVSWSVNAEGTVAYGGASIDAVTVNGVSPSWFALSDLGLESGRIFSEAEDSARARVCLIGADIASELFPDGIPEEATISISGSRFMVVGAAEARGSVFGRSLDSFVDVPFSTYEGLFANLGPAVDISILPVGGASTSESSEEARVALRLIRGLEDGDEDNFYIRSQTGAQERMDEMLAVVAAITVGIAAISLLVGGIGIMNIMLVTVAERVREIGTRRALGATRLDIVRQFLLESVLISLVGGAAGLAAGSLVILAARAATPIPASLNGFVVLAALVFSTAVGVASGLLPAVRAASIDPVEALRHE